ncbi:MAG: type II toxin-antitoxin system RelB/DinJ family antitoxin [Candidatus Omnitrophica bacterium]|nr:type II toxin-antitoxin system RelB/DinJ family antitoxin [Candidatus Omnitrophota bacterium]
MIKKARIETRIDAGLKKRVLGILKQLDISEAEAIRMYYRQIAINQGIPFELKIPNKETLKALAETKNKKLKKYSSFDEYTKKSDLT